MDVATAFSGTMLAAAWGMRWGGVGQWQQMRASAVAFAHNADAWEWPE
jgi:hypothetical protein